MDWGPEPLLPQDNEEVRIRKAAFNSQVYSADLLLNELEGVPLRFDATAGNYDGHEFYEHLYFGREYLDFYILLRNYITSCYDAIAVGNNGIASLLIIPEIVELGGLVHCEELNRRKDEFQQRIEMNDQILLALSDYLLQFNLLWMLTDRVAETFPPYRNGPFSMMMTWTKFGRDFWNDNNIAIKGFAGSAMSGVRYGRKGHSDYAWPNLRGILERKFTTDGAYPEGTDYLDYLNQETLPLIYLSRVAGWLRDDEIPQNYLESGNWFLEIADISGRIPPVDDAANSAQSAGRTYWLAPFAHLLNDNRFMDYTRRTIDQIPFPMNKPTDFTEPNAVKTISMLLTYPALRYPQPFQPPNVVFSGGVGKLNWRDSHGANLGLTLIAEGGHLRVEGFSHDQQDGGSIEITRQSTASLNIDKLI